MSENKTKPIAVAIGRFPFHAPGDRHLSFQKNETLMLIQSHDSGWWLGKNEKGTVGLFPANYVVIKKWLSDEARIKHTGSDKDNKELQWNRPMKHKNTVPKSDTDDMMASLGFDEEVMNNLLSDDSDESDEDTSEQVLPQAKVEPSLIPPSQSKKEDIVPLEKYKRLKDDLEQLQKDNEVLRKQMKENKQIELQKKQNKLLVSQIQKLKEEKESLTQTVNEFRSNSSLLISQAKQPENTANNKELESAKEEISQLREKLSSITTSLSSQEVEAKNLKEQNQYFENHIAKLNQELNHLQNQSEADSKVKLQSSNLEAEITKLKNQLMESEKRYNDYVSNATEESKSHSNEIATLQKKLESAEKINKELVSDSKASEKLSEAMEQLKQCLDTSEKENQDLSNRIDIITMEFEAKITTLEETITNLTYEKSKLEKDKEISKRSESEAISRLNKEIELLKTKEEKERNHASKYAQAVKKLDSDLKKSKADYEESQAIIARLQKQTDASTALISKLKNLKQFTHQLKKQQQSFQTESKMHLNAFLKSLGDLNKSAIQPMANAIDTATEKYKEEAKKRRLIYNELQDLKGKIRICVRVRPILNSDKSEGPSVKCLPDVGEVRVSDHESKKTYKYEFDKVFNPKTGQAQVFEDVKGLAISILDGYNVCIFAYGQTGSGKTHTMDGTPNDRGLNYRTIAELFNIANEREKEFDYNFRVSCTEIYLEQVYDLLAKSKTQLKIQMAGNTTKIPDLTKVDVKDVESVITQFDRSKQNRAQACTDMNEHSSRSHAVVSIYVKGINKITGIKYSGKLNLIDLAGSERVKLSGVTGQRMEEAKSINFSLSALGDVISALGAKKSHIPYRNSKLTSLLQDSLGGNSKVMMFVNVSPCMEHTSETICSLKFANRVKEVELGKVKANVKKIKDEK